MTTALIYKLNYRRNERAYGINSYSSAGAPKRFASRTTWQV